jgi:hypothetical protein
MQLNRYYLTGFRYVSLFTLQREEGKVEEGKGGRERRKETQNQKYNSFPFLHLQCFSAFQASCAYWCGAQGTEAGSG